MKFTKEDAVKNLAAKFLEKDKDIDLSRTINEQVENMLALVGDDESLELDKFVSVVEKAIKTSIGLARFETSSAVKKKDVEIDDLKKKITTTEPKPPVEPNKTNQDNPELKAILERLQTLESERSAEITKGKISEKRKSLIEKIKADGVKNTDWISDMVNNASVTEEMDVDAESKKYVEMYNKYFANTPIDIAPKSPNKDSDLSKNPVLEMVRQKQKAKNGTITKQEEKNN
jgi:hypothetical protein